MSNDSKKLTIKQERFVREVSTGKPASEAVVAAGYRPTTPHSAAQMGHELMKNPRIQNALQAQLETDYPGVTRKAAEVLYRMLDDEMTAPMLRIKIIELLMKIYGWQAPTRHAQVNVSVKDQWKLPED